MKIKMVSQMIRALSAAVLAVCMMTTAVTGVQAAGTPSYLIDTSETASLTIYKYDMTAAENADIPVSESSWQEEHKATGAADSTLQDTLSEYALKGVKFTYLKVADIEMEVTQDNGICLIYDLPAALDYILGFSAAADTDAAAVTSDEINDKLSGLLSGSSRTETLNALESYVTSNDGTVMEETGSNGSTSATDLALGLYLVVETAVPEDVYSTTDPFFLIFLKFSD